MSTGSAPIAPPPPPPPPCPCRVGEAREKPQPTPPLSLLPQSYQRTISNPRVMGKILRFSLFPSVDTREVQFREAMEREIRENDSLLGVALRLEMANLLW